MDKREYLTLLEAGLRSLPPEEREERLAFYGEMIDDRVEAGLSEAEAAAEIGPPAELAARIIEETPLTELMREQVRRSRRPRAWVIVLLALGSPIWLSLVISVFAVVISLYISAWAVVISLWAADLSLGISAPAGVAAGLWALAGGSAAGGIGLIGAGFMCAGLAILLFLACRGLTLGLVHLTRAAAIGMKHWFVKKEVME